METNVNRRRLLLGLASASAAAAALTVEATASAVADEAALPTRTAKEEAIWHLRELVRLLKEDGATRYVVMVVGNDYPDGSGPKCIQICDDAFRDDDSGMFGTKGGDA